MSREYDAGSCECGRTTWRPAVGRWVCTSAIWPNPGHCEHCGTRVGIDERGPWRERMVPMTVAEELAAQCAWHDCPEPCPHGYDGPEGECEHEPEGCWLDAALKAAEEADECTPSD